MQPKLNVTLSACRTYLIRPLTYMEIKKMEKKCEKSNEKRFEVHDPTIR